MLSHQPPIPQPPASFDQVTSLPPKNASAPLAILTRGDRPFLYQKLAISNNCPHATDHNDSYPATLLKAALTVVGISSVAILGVGWLPMAHRD